MCEEANVDSVEHIELDPATAKLTSVCGLYVALVGEFGDRAPCFVAIGKDAWPALDALRREGAAVSAATVSFDPRYYRLETTEQADEVIVRVVPKD